MMPRFVGCRPEVGDRPYPDAGGERLVQLTWRQAERVRLHGGQVYYRLNTSDRGAPGRRAKRWFNWFADVDDVLRANPTESMYHRAAGACLGRQLPRDLMDLYHAQALEENARRDALRARIDALQAHLRPTCLRAVVGSQVIDLSMRRAPALFIVERLHDVGGTLVSELSGDLEAAVQEARRLQEGHDRVYHPEQAARC